jgi:hypothetical protein
MTSKMEARTSAAARCAPERTRPATPAPADPATGVVRLRPRLQLPVAARDRIAYGQHRRVTAGPSPYGYTPA